MPFTLSHPAAVVPLRRLCPRYLDFAALLIGCMMPDAGYYVPHVPSYFAHSFLGSFTVSLPCGVFFWLLYLALRQSVCFLLPEPHRSALLELARKPVKWSVRYVASVIVSLLVGTWTHILWDGFTHGPGWFVQRIPWLQETAFVMGSNTFRIFDVFQHLSTLFGAVVLYITCDWNWRRNFRN